MDFLLGVACGWCGGLTIYFRKPLGQLLYTGFWEAAAFVFVIILSATFGCAAGVEWASLK